MRIDGWTVAAGLAAALVAGTAASAASLTPAKCDVAKARCAWTYVTGLLACNGTAEKKGVAPDPTCGDKCRDAFQSCIGKLDARPAPCSSRGAADLTSAVGAFAGDVGATLDRYPPPAKDTCAARKTKCVAQLVKRLLGCDVAYFKKPDTTKRKLCTEKSVTKFTSSGTGCFEKLEAKLSCATSHDADGVEKQATTFVDRVSKLLGRWSVDLTVGDGGGSFCGAIDPGPATKLLDTEHRRLTCGRLALGDGVSYLAENLIPSGSTNRFRVVDCPQGSCITGMPDAGLPLGVNGSTAGSFFGPPIQMRVATANLAGCVLNRFKDDASGTIDVETGVVAVNVDLEATTWLNGRYLTDPCPKCAGYEGVPGPGSPKTGTCERGANDGGPCVTVDVDGFSPQCLPCSEYACNGHAWDGGQLIGTLAIDLTPLTTGSAVMSDANGLFCPGQGTHRHDVPIGCFNSQPLQNGDPDVVPHCTSIAESGVPAGALTDGVPAPVTVGSVFCVDATSSTFINREVGLPGPGALTLTGTLRLNL